jgi:hypothetical protein
MESQCVELRCRPLWLPRHLGHMVCMSGNPTVHQMTKRMLDPRSAGLAPRHGLVRDFNWTRSTSPLNFQSTRIRKELYQIHLKYSLTTGIVSLEKVENPRQQHQPGHSQELVQDTRIAYPRLKMTRVVLATGRLWITLSSV